MRKYETMAAYESKQRYMDVTVRRGCEIAVVGVDLLLGLANSVSMEVLACFPGLPGGKCIRDHSRHLAFNAFAPF